MTSPTPSPRWAAGDKAMVEIVDVATDVASIRGNSERDTCWIGPHRLRPLPSATAEDEAPTVEEVRRALTTYYGTDWQGSNLIPMTAALREFVNGRNAIRSQGAETTRKEAWEPKVGETVRRKHDGATGVVARFTGETLWVAMGDGTRAGGTPSAFEPLTPSPAPAIEAARERVCQAALTHRKTLSAGLHVDGLTASESKELLEAVDALAALLPPPPTPDQVRELVEAARPLLALKLVHGKPGEHDFFWVTPQEMDRLRSALATMDALT